MNLIRCDGGCGATLGARDGVLANWVSFTPRAGVGEDKRVLDVGTQHLCPECWARMWGAIHPSDTTPWHVAQQAARK